jgi:hypothetical protein
VTGVPATSRGSTGAAAAQTLLSTTTLAVDGTFDVATIDQTYNDLLLVCICRATRAATTEVLGLRFNNDSAGNYDFGVTYNQNSTQTVNTSTAQTSIQPNWRVPAASATAAYFAQTWMYVAGYASTTWRKSMIGQWEGQSAIGAANSSQGNSAGWWASTAAINRVQIFGVVTANLLTGSVLRIYGIL